MAGLVIQHNISIPVDEEVWDTRFAFHLAFPLLSPLSLCADRVVIFGTVASRTLHFPTSGCSSHYSTL